MENTTQQGKEPSTTQKRCCHRPHRSGAGFAILLLAAGVALLGFNLGWFPIEYRRIILSWQMLLIVVGIWNMARRNWAMGIVVFCIGAFFLLPRLVYSFPDVFGDVPTNFGAYWPVLLILAGVMALLHIFRGDRHGRYNRDYEDDRASRNSFTEQDGHIKRDLMFDSAEHIVITDSFRGGEINVCFGEYKIDLRRARTTTEDNLLDVSAMFGSVIVYVPAEWKLNIVSSSMLFASLNDTRMLSAPDNDPGHEAPVLNLKASCLFGSIEIRN